MHCVKNRILGRVDKEGAVRGQAVPWQGLQPHPIASSSCARATLLALLLRGSRFATLFVASFPVSGLAERERTQQAKAE